MQVPPTHYDLAVMWNWEYDSDFVGLVREAAVARSLSLLLIDEQSVTESYERFRHNSFTVRLVLDRASDEDERFLPLAHLFQRRSSSALRIINPYDLMRKAADKATMHLELLTHGVHVPYTIIISPYNHKRELELSLSELAHLGRPFIIKPANTTGGGIGVVLGAESLKDVIETRQHHKNDKYLLQEKIVPVQLGEHRGWFRVFFAFGETILCWWDNQTHVYDDITVEEENRFNLTPLREIALTIRNVCQLDFFSTEVAAIATGHFVVVDYVNEMCDMRLKSIHPDGIPDSIVAHIAGRIVELADTGTDTNQP